MVQPALHLMNKEELAATLTPEYFNNDPWGGKAYTAYYQVKRATTGPNTRRISKLKRKLQQQIAACALLNDWQCHTWRDTGGGLANQSPSDYYFDMTLGKGECFTFVYLKPDNTATAALLRDEQNWYNLMTNLNIPVIICTPSTVNNMRTLLTSREPTRQLLEQLFPQQQNFPR